MMVSYTDPVIAVLKHCSSNYISYSCLKVLNTGNVKIVYGSGRGYYVTSVRREFIALPMWCAAICHLNP